MRIGNDFSEAALIALDMAGGPKFHPALCHRQRSGALRLPRRGQAVSRSPVRSWPTTRGRHRGSRANAERRWRALAFRSLLGSALAPADPPGLVASNPPYGVRVGESDPLRNLYAQLGNVLRRRRPGWTLALLSADPRLEEQTRLSFTQAIRTRNGGIPVRLVVARVPERAPTDLTESPR